MGKVIKTGGYICIERPNDNDYCIGCERVDTPEKLFGVIEHLCGKVWFDRLLCRELIQICSECVHGITIDRNW